MPGAISNLFSPWLMRGIGQAQPYPTFYIVGFVLFPFSFLPPALFVGALVFSVALLAGFAGASIATSLRSPAPVQVACALIATLNPWVYSEMVAGHVFMVLAYTFVLLLASELLREQPRAALILMSALLILQIEFFTFAALPVLAALIWRRQWLAVLALAVAALPIAFGIAAHYSNLRDTPYIVEWQLAQIVPILDAVVLRGYFAHYDRAFSQVAPVLALLSLASPLALIDAIRNRNVIVGAAICLGMIALLGASAIGGFATGLYQWIVLHVTESGVFRELYDLIAFAALALVVSVAYFARRSRFLGWGAAAAAAALVLPWLISPPYQWFVPASQLQQTTLPGTDQDRVALYPSLQPLTFEGRGSGYDPDLFTQPGRAIPVNQFFVAYPESSALTFAAAGDDSWLGALGTHFVLLRPHLREDAQTLAYTAPVAASTVPLQSHEIASSQPVLGLTTGTPPQTQIGNDVTRTGMFFADDPLQAAQFAPMSMQRVFADPSRGWVDARLKLPELPWLGTRFAGVFTTSRAALSVPRAKAILAWTNGKLEDQDGRHIASHTPSLAWFQLAPETTAVVCDGECAVIGTGNPPAAPAQGAAAHFQTLHFTWITPWWVRADIPAHGESTLRWNESFERSWTLVGNSARHIVIDQTLNGWILSEGAAQHDYIMNITAAIQFSLEVVSFITILALAGIAQRASGISHHSEQSNAPKVLS